MAAKHGTRRRYNEGCRCEDCTADNTAYHQEYRQRPIGDEPANPSSVVTVSSPVTPGPVEAGVEAEIAGLADARPGLAAAPLALARILDNPRAVSSQPVAAKVRAMASKSVHPAAHPPYQSTAAAQPAPEPHGEEPPPNRSSESITSMSRMGGQPMPARHRPSLHLAPVYLLLGGAQAR
jgi:hypothetical protein